MADLTSQFSFLEKCFHSEKIFSYPQNFGDRTAGGRSLVLFSTPSTSSDNQSQIVRYFDHGGVTFGQAIQSSGVLLLNVNDLRVVSASTSLTTVDSRFLEAIQTVVPELISQDVKVKNITIPAGTYTEFDVLVSTSSDASVGGAYALKFSLDSDIKNQLDIFRIFRTQKMADGALRPQYVDLRFDGRVYYK